MKARILPLAEIAEYGKADTVVLTLSINPTEAGIVLDWMESEGVTVIPTAVRYLTGVLETIRDRVSTVGYRQDVINTDSRSLLGYGRPEGTARGAHNLPGLHG